MGQPRQDAKCDAMYSLYCEGYSLAAVAAAFGVTRQSVHKMFVKRGYKLRDRLPPLPFVVFNDQRYTRRVGGYYAATSNRRRYLHRDMWSAAHGPIPNGMDVHHRNHDRADNRLANFQLLTKDAHTKLHQDRKPH